MLRVTLVLLSSPRFKEWALLNAKRQGAPVLCVVNSTPIEEFGKLDPDVTWAESAPGKPNALAKAGEWLQTNAPDALVIQHDQDDYYPDGSAEVKLKALMDSDVVGSQVRRVWFECGDETHLHNGSLEDYWHTWGGSYAWRASAFVPTSGPSKMYDDVYWLDAMVRSGAKFRGYETRDVYCRWKGHRHVWCLRDEELRSTLRLRKSQLDEPIMAEAMKTRAIHGGQDA